MNQFSRTKIKRFTENNPKYWPQYPSRITLLVLDKLGKKIVKYLVEQFKIHRVIVTLPKG